MNISSVLTYQFEIKTCVFVFGMMIYGKIKCMIKDHLCRDSNRGATTNGANVKMLEVKEQFIMVIDNYDSRTFRPVAIMIAGKAEISPSGSFRISHQY